MDQAPLPFPPPPETPLPSRLAHIAEDVWCGIDALQVRHMELRTLVVCQLVALAIGLSVGAVHGGWVGMASSADHIAAADTQSGAPS